MRALFTLAILAILHFSLHPWTIDAARFGRTLHWHGVRSGSDYTDVLLNLFFYLPPALIGQWAFQTAKTQTGKTQLRTLFLLMSGLTLLSLTVEVLQLAIPGRFGSFRDVACNAAGTLAGCLLGILIPPPARLAMRWNLSRQTIALAIFLAAWTTWLAFPFLPQIRLHRLIVIPELLFHPAWAVTDMADIFFTLLTIYLIAQSLKLHALPITIAAALLLPAQAFLRDVTLSPARLTAAGLAILTAVALLRHPTRQHYLFLAALISLWILYRQLAPALFVPEHVNVFSWIPFRPLIENQSAGAVRILAGKFLLYASALWLSGRAGLSPHVASAALVLLLAITEGLQCYIPNRTPETTDLVLALLGTWTLAPSPKPQGRAAD